MTGFCPDEPAPFEVMWTKEQYPDADVDSLVGEWRTVKDLTDLGNWMYVMGLPPALVRVGGKNGTVYKIK